MHHATAETAECVLQRVLGVFWGAFTTGRYISQREKNVMYCQSTEETLGQGEGKSARQ